MSVLHEVDVFSETLVGCWICQDVAMDQKPVPARICSLPAWGAIYPISPLTPKERHGSRLAVTIECQSIICFVGSRYYDILCVVVVFVFTGRVQGESSAKRIHFQVLSVINAKDDTRPWSSRADFWNVKKSCPKDLLSLIWSKKTRFHLVKPPFNNV